VLDVCFNKNNMICSPMTIGRIAKNAYKKQLVECAKQTKKHNRDAPIRKKQPQKFLRLHAPSELQFVSLFGYLQIQCNTNSMDNCTNNNFKEMLSNCETAILQRSSLVNSDLERHQLLKIKLDASSRLLQYPETNRDNECLMVRSALSDIYQLHQKYCFETYVTRCLCERLTFTYSCNIDCEQLEASDLPFDQEISWQNFKGRLPDGFATPRLHELRGYNGFATPRLYESLTFGSMLAT
uniref:Uncharacterized protein n=1 Tax=Acrobeloides nanus TaxID=290746 RepID=A0A914DU02_9BILA